MRPLFATFSRVTFAALLCACFTGAEREKDAPVGRPGGKCLAPDGRCKSGTCNLDENYCFDATDPCDGFYCGGSERGACMVTQAGLPACTCAPGYNLDKYSLYCCPDDAASDPACVFSQSGDGTESSGG